MNKLDYEERTVSSESKISCHKQTLFIAFPSVSLFSNNAEIKQYTVAWIHTFNVIKTKVSNA